METINTSEPITEVSADVDNLSLFDIADNDNISDTDTKEIIEQNKNTQNVSQKQQPKEQNAYTSDKNQQEKQEESQEPKEWFYTDKIKGEGMSPEWFNHKTFKNITEQARAYNEARKQITQYSEKLKAFSGAPEEYEESEDIKKNVFAVGLKELGKKIGLNQPGFDNLIEMYNKSKEIESEKVKNILMQQQKEEVKKIGGVSKLKEIQAKFTDAFGDNSTQWLKKYLKSYDDYVNFDRMISSVSGKTRLPVNSMESSVSTKEQAEELIRDPRWGKDREFTKKADKLLNYMLQSK